eukprot:TRINITY_DN18241_c0_g2_i1.p1 TRINITY_DN18241_c0_g2~~TRINITY_DN18241_c0_g2_i1.p1  ORF type:complete len:634 (+),score=83.04 TRINITY_DN18241_c0_g2_i1:48-1904(+)
MASFQIVGNSLQPSGQGLETNELNALDLLRKFTGDRREVVASRALLQLGRMRAMREELLEYNSALAGSLDVATAAHCQARVVELLSSMGLSSGKPAVLDDLDQMISTIEALNEEQLSGTRQRIAAGSIEFLDLAEIYHPGTEVSGPVGGLSQEMGFLVRSCHFEEAKTPFGIKHSFHLELEFFGSVGEKFGAIRCQEQVGWWRGCRQVSGLIFQPLPSNLRTRLEERGKLYADVASGQRFLFCRQGSFLTGKRVAGGTVREGRVMVDVVAAMESGQKAVLSAHGDAAPNALDVQTEYYRKAVRQGRLEKKDPAVQRDEAAGVLVIDRMIYFDAVPEKRLWNCWPLVLAYHFSSKLWGYAEVGGLKPVTWEDGAWNALVLPPRRKALIKAVVQKQRDVGSIDVIKGKGEGATFLLYGPPGTGKTLTAEAMAEVLHKPLYVMSAGEMGTTPKELEDTLAEALRLCSRWDCLCLIDEADIFLEQRSGKDVLRNALVCVMLRQLEYHAGVLFLTTNKASGIDTAIQSRLTLALKYDPLDEQARREVWESLLKRVEGGPFDAMKLASKGTNGRQIKNCLRLSMALALNEAVPLTQMILEDTLETICAFQRDLSEDVGCNNEES